MLFDVLLLLLLLLLLARFVFDFSLLYQSYKTRKQTCTVQYSTGITIYSYFRSFALTSLYNITVFVMIYDACVGRKGERNDLYDGVYKKERIDLCSSVCP